MLAMAEMIVEPAIKPDWSAHWDNAKIIAGIPEEEICKLNVFDLISRGLRV